MSSFPQQRLRQLVPRHIQNFSEAKSLEPHWGYADRALPCTNDAASCEYLTSVYHSHDVGMLYIGIVWATLFGILFLWSIGRRMMWTSSPSIVGPAAAYRAGSQGGNNRADAEKFSEAEEHRNLSFPGRFAAAAASTARRHLLPDALPGIFGRTTRLQVLVLAMLVGYLTIWSFVGITYATWISPAKGGLYNTRTALGPWSNRIGTLAYGMTPLSVLLASRESILSLVTGVPYTSFNFLHRWLGYVILLQGLLHTIGWTVVEARLYQPQPSTAQEWIKQTYIVWGCVAIILLSLLWALSLPVVVRRTGYEFFRKTHYVLAMLYIGACWGHWSKLKCFLLPSLLLWFLDRGVRLVRAFFLHYNFISPEQGLAFRPAQASVRIFADAEHGDVVRLDWKQQQQPWCIGQHFYLCFTETSIWQSHPFTPLSYPRATNALLEVQHSYVFRAKGGETKKVAALAAEKIQQQNDTTSVVGSGSSSAATSIILTGPYGESISDVVERETTMNVVCVAGGTGITYVLPVLKHAVRLQQGHSPADAPHLELVWIVKHAADCAWVQAELDELRRSQRVTIRVLTTRDRSNSQHGHGKQRSSGTSTTEKHNNDEHGATPPTSTPASEDEIQVVAELAKGGGQTHQSKDARRRVHGNSGAAAGSLTLQRQPLHIERGSNQSRDHGSTDGRPDMDILVDEALRAVRLGATTVYASGPGSMLSDVRVVVARANTGRGVWHGVAQADVRLVCDDRMEWA